MAFGENQNVIVHEEDDETFEGRTGRVTDIRTDVGAHENCTETHYYVDLKATSTAPAVSKLLLHERDLKAV